MSLKTDPIRRGELRMTQFNTRKAALAAASALALSVSLLSAGGAMAQVTTSTLRGTVYDGQSPETGGSIIARDTTSVSTMVARSRGTST